MTYKVAQTTDFVWWLHLSSKRNNQTSGKKTEAKEIPYQLNYFEEQLGAIRYLSQVSILEFHFIFVWIGFGHDFIRLVHFTVTF